MGCSASVHHEDAVNACRPESHAAYQSTAAAAAFAFTARPEHSDVPDKAYGVMTPDEADEVQLLDEEYSYHSGGSECGEPGPLARNLDETKRCVVARFSHGITPDPWQFPAGAECAAAIKRSCAAVRDWFAELPLSGQAAPRCPVCMLHRSSTATEVGDGTNLHAQHEGGPEAALDDSYDRGYTSETVSGPYLSGIAAAANGGNSWVNSTSVASGCLSCSRVSMQLPHTPRQPEPNDDAAPGWASGPDGPRFGDSPQSRPLRRFNITEDILGRHLALLRKDTASAL